MQPDAKQLKTISKMVEDGDIKPIVDLIYSFEDGIDAYLYGYRQSQRKVIISMS
jgi:NADPH:quinone reductase-like Zn-dependent oxidoreductase